MTSHSALFFQSDMADPYPFYERQLRQQPVVWHEQDQIWAAYSYQGCQQLLQHTDLRVPTPAWEAGLSSKAQLVRSQLVRLTNPPLHKSVRQLTQRLYDARQPVAIADLVANQLRPFEGGGPFDWVAVVAKRLPAEALLAGFGFNPVDSALVLSKLDTLTRWMGAGPTLTECQAINEATEQIMSVLEGHIQAWPALVSLFPTKTDPTAILSVLGSNLLGLLIQSYDAGRGLLTNALVQALKQYGNRPQYELDSLRRLVVETLRFDPPIHNTRRLLVKDLVVGDQHLKKGQAVLIVLAAANRDGHSFANPHQFDPDRPANDRLLTFGTGIHACLARHIAVDQTAQALAYLFKRFPQVQRIEEHLHYERLVNARLIGQLHNQLH